MNQASGRLRSCQELQFTTHDRMSLFYRYWPGLGEGPSRAIVLFHRELEHSERIMHLVDELDLPACHFFAWDARGMGRSVQQGRSRHGFADLVKDVDSFMRHIGIEHGIAFENMALVAQSSAAVAVAVWVHDYAPGIAAMVLAGAGFKRRFSNPLLLPCLGLRDEDAQIDLRISVSQLSHDPLRNDAHDKDPLIGRWLPARVVKGWHASARRISKDAQPVFVPTQLLMGAADTVVDGAAQQLFHDRIGAKVKEIRVFEGMAHDVLGELGREQVLGTARQFILARFAQIVPQPDLRNAHLAGVTCDELARLKQPPASFIARCYWALTRWSVRALAYVSEGMKIGAETGFDSGSTLDYVYRNQSQGVTPLGKMLDRVYLNSISWRGIRVRKPHVERLIADAVGRLRQAGQPVRIVDIAAGHGRYILEVLARQRQSDVQILLRDFAPINIEQGRELIARLGMQDCARFELGDGFDRASLAAITPRPTLAVACGLYELFPDNMLVQASLAGLGDALDSGSYLVYTTNPWHPQLEMVARGLTTHRDGHSQFFMRRRFQAEMDQMVAAAGFVKLDQLIDEWGIFSVSLARKL